MLVNCSHKPRQSSSACRSDFCFRGARLAHPVVSGNDLLTLLNGRAPQTRQQLTLAFGEGQRAPDVPKMGIAAAGVHVLGQTCCVQAMCLFKSPAFSATLREITKVLEVSVPQEGVQVTNWGSELCIQPEFQQVSVTQLSRGDLFLQSCSDSSAFSGPAVVLDFPRVTSALKKGCH